MRLIDKIALNRLIKIITDFVLAICKMFSPTVNVEKPEKKRPLLDKLRRWIK